MYDSTAMPIRSCLKIDDELVSNFGPPLRKTVTFNCYIRVFPALTPLEPSPSTSTKVQPQPKKSSFKSMPAQRKGLQKVSFSSFCTTIEPNGRSYTSVVTLEEDDCWKPGAMDGEPLYIMNFQTI